MTITSSCGWWTLSASSSMNVLTCSFVTLILRDHLESWTFCTTFKYVFLDLEDCPVEVLPIMTLISLNGGRDGSSKFPFNFLSLWSHWRKFLNFLCLMRFFICCFKSKHSFVSCLWSLWKRQYLFLLCLLGSLFIFFAHFKEGSSLICISTCSSGMFKGVYCWLRAKELAFLLSRSFFVVSIFLLSHLSLLWMRTLLRIVREIWLHSLSLLPLLSYNCVLCIHEVLGRMD